MRTDDFFTTKYHVKLIVPSGWLIIKNHLIDVDLEILNSLDEDTQFRLENLSFYSDVFSAQYELRQLHPSYIVDVHVFCQTTKIKHQYKSLEYSIDCVMYKKKTKSRREEFTFNIEGKESLDIQQLTEKLSEVLILVSSNIYRMHERKDYTQIEFLLNPNDFKTHQ